MSFESVPTHSTETEQFAEKRQELHENLGIVFCTEQKDGTHTRLLDHIHLAETLGLPSVQFDFRKRSEEEIIEACDTLRAFREAHPDVDISIHGETPKIDPETLEIQNKKHMSTTLEYASELGIESYTMHPLALRDQLWKELSAEAQHALLTHYASLCAQSFTNHVTENTPSCSIAIENMPKKGAEGAWGQTPEDIHTLVQYISEYCMANGVTTETVEDHIGITLDINHALHDVDPADWEAELTSWFKIFGTRIRVIHLYAPSHYGETLNTKYQLVLDLAARYSPDAHVFLESKQDTEKTAEVYSSMHAAY
ncbi:TIM barrel protein [Candidatus Campbellbacteria bacterium]|nr:MAG: TIM barrel protein [Candidatus Campbellbacteria bacterium]